MFHKRKLFAIIREQPSLYIYCNNVFTGIPLFKDLLKNKIYASGTIYSDKKFYPIAFKPTLKKRLKKRGEFKLLQHGSLLMTMWQDTKVVSVLAINS